MVHKNLYVPFVGIFFHIYSDCIIHFCVYLQPRFCANTYTHEVDPFFFSLNRNNYFRSEMSLGTRAQSYVVSSYTDEDVLFSPASCNKNTKAEFSFGLGSPVFYFIGLVESEMIGA